MTSGADTLIATLLNSQVDVCFANPGTSEMHFMGALDRNPRMRCILGLFEGVVTGAADGYYRIAQRPAATLLHLAPGLANGLANLHNARKARSGIVNIVGDHTTYFAEEDSPLSGDIEGIARAVSGWVRTTVSAAHIASDAAEAIQVAGGSPGKIATLILPADVSWGSAGEAVTALPPAPRRTVSEGTIAVATDALRRGGSRAALLLGDASLRGRALELAGLIADATGCRVLSEIHNARVERGVGRVDAQRIPYSLPVENSLAALTDLTELVLVGALSPVAFFAHPGKPTRLHPDTCLTHTLARPVDDIIAALEGVADRLGIALTGKPTSRPRHVPQDVQGPFSMEGLGIALASAMPENAIIVDESLTSGRSFYAQCADAAPHDWMVSRGASIGFSLPTAIGAAVAAPDRKVIALTGDGSAMYTLQSLWTMVRESLEVTVVVFANRAYRILDAEYRNLGLGAPSETAKALLDIGNPDLQWVSLAKGMGMEAVQVSDLQSFAQALRRATSATGPGLIEVLL